MERTPSRASSSVSMPLLIPALGWSVALVVVLGFVVPPGPGSAWNWVVLVLLVLGTSGVHAGLLLLGATLARRRDGRPGAALDAAVALAGGALYTLLLLSLAKFVATHAHLNATDLRFLAPSWAQVVGEGTAAERRTLAMAALLPLAVGALLFGLERAARRRSRRAESAAGWRPALALLAGALALVGALAAFDPVARWATTTLLPEAALVRLAGALTRSESARPAAAPTSGAALPVYRPEPPAVRANVVIVMLESVPWRRLFGPDARPASTPHLVALAEQSILFERAYAASTHSDYAQTAILASLHPRKRDRHDFFTDLAYPRALPWDVLGAAGWRSGIFSTQNERWGNMDAFTVTPALGTLRHAPDFPAAPHRGEGAETKIFEETAVRALLAWLDGEPTERRSPFVAYLNFQATHYPYVWPTEAGPGIESETFAPPFGPAPLDFDATFLGYPREKVPRMLDRFHNALAYADLWLGRLIEELRARGLWETTALVVVADHGEAFYEHGVPTHGTTLHDEQVRVPMLLRLQPSLLERRPIAQPRRIAEPVATIDLLPTLYRALGLPRHGALQGRDDLLEPSYTAAGRPLLFTIQGMTSEDGLLLDGWKWVVNRDRNQAALYRIESDPDERGDRMPFEPEVAQALLARLDALVAGQLAYYRERAWERGLEPPRLP